jgi:hypothetical protein
MRSDLRRLRKVLVYEAAQHIATIDTERQGSDDRPQPMGMRWPVERTNAWLAAYGQLRRNTDRKTVHRLAQFALAVAFMLTAKLIDYRNRWSRILAPIR